MRRSLLTVAAMLLAVVVRASCPLRVDAVDKVGDEQRAGNNRIQMPRFRDSWQSTGNIGITAIAVSVE